jgi:hypothetical protein
LVRRKKVRETPGSVLLTTSLPGAFKSSLDKIGGKAGEFMVDVRSVLLGLGLILSAAMPTPGQAARLPPSSSDLLERARAQLMSDVARQSRYTCVQNVTRRVYESDSKAPHSCGDGDIIAGHVGGKHDARLISSDHLQLDVAIAENREIHSWPGASAFAEEEIRELVGSGGPFGSGDFAAFIVGIFGGSATVKFEKARTVDGHKDFEYTFDVPQSASNYAIASSGGTIATAYGGSFLLDTQTADLVQLSVRTAELPDATNACLAISAIEYQRIGIHGQGVLIPRETNLRTIFRDGTETASVTAYSNCREYAGHAVLRFDVAEATTETETSLAGSAEPSMPAAPTSPFPLGLTFECRIVTPIDADTPAGRPIETLLRTPLRGTDGQILANVGSKIHGRLVRVAEYKSPHHYFEVDVRLDTIELNGTNLPLYAVLTRQTPASTVERDLRENRFSDFASTPPRNVGAFFFAQKHLDVHQWDSTWLITLPEASAGARKEPQRLAEAPQRGSEKEAAQNFILAIGYSQQAADLLNSKNGAADVADNPSLSDVLAYSRKAIEAGEAADPDRLNDLYPGLGDKFRLQFLKALTLFVHSREIQNQSASVAQAELSQSTLLYDEWANWYEPLRRDIAQAVGSRAPNASPAEPR